MNRGKRKETKKFKNIQPKNKTSRMMYKGYAPDIFHRVTADLYMSIS